MEGNVTEYFRTHSISEADILEADHRKSLFINGLAGAPREE